MRGRLVVIALFASLLIGDADAADGPAEVLQAEVVLKAGEINSSTTKIARDSTQTGYGRAVDRLGETPDTLSGKTDDMGTRRRIASKLVAGALVGNLSFFGLAQMLASGCDRDDGICGAVAYTIGMSLFYPVGTASGVNLVDPRPQFAASLLGSMLGIGVGFGLAKKYDNIWPLFVCPSIFATVMSELSRFDLPSVFMSHNSPEFSRLSVGLMPGPKRSLSAVATLRF